uniref:Ig-like domain-containing protein n=1 Tax=Maylandia zebra TaxID=106582 RepID=A0A3P9C8X7_9CICH
ACAKTLLFQRGGSRSQTERWVNSATHSLIYIYTALSADLGLPGVHKFTAIGLVDGKPFDRFDTDNPRKTPTTNWARERLTSDYWAKGTQSRLSKQQWFGVNLDVVMTLCVRWGSTCSTVVARMLRETNPSEERLRFVSGVDKYAYDGDDLMSFDYVTGRWSAETEVAKTIVDKWNAVTLLTEYTIGYLHGECIDWLTRFVEYSKRGPRERATAPDVYVFTLKTNGTTLTLICLASGFSTNTDGLKVFDTLPNDDDTYQRRIAVDILPSDTGNFTCHVGDRQTLRALGWPNAVLPWALMSTVLCLCTVALCLVVVCIVRKRRTGHIVNQTDRCPTTPRARR